MRWKPVIALACAGMLMFVVRSPEAGQAADSPAYRGAKSCKKCHFRQHRSWKATTMALAFESLQPGAHAEAKTAAGLDPDADYTHDAKCLPCHTTGYGKPGGFVSIEETPDLAGIQCDACHGPSAAYLEIMTNDNKDHPIKEMTDKGLIYPSTEAQCMTCHSAESPFNASVDPKYAFDFEERVRDEDGTHTHSPLKAKHPDLDQIGVIFQ